MRAVGVSIAGALVALAISCSTAAASSGNGLEPGVHVDPGSPAAKEYALPLNQARQTGGVSSRESSPEAALFGAGIKPTGSGGSGSGGSPRAGSGSHGAGATGRHPVSGASSGNGPSPGSAALPAAVVRAARDQGSSGGSGSLLALLGGGIAILVLGGFGGTVLRHSRRPTPSP
jgi:hypothetical protein